MYRRRYCWAYTELLLSLGRRTGCMQLAHDVLHDAFLRYLCQRIQPFGSRGEYFSKLC
jgi:hypothetical protein